MDQQQIKACIDAMSASDLAEMQFSQDGWTLRLVRRSGEVPSQALPAARSIGDHAATPGEFAAATSVPALCAPLYGVVHWSPAPGEPRFVDPGDTVSVGQVVCVIEAMKVFNEVRADREATIAEMLVTAGAEVEAGQPLVRFA